MEINVGAIGIGMCNARINVRAIGMCNARISFAVCNSACSDLVASTSVCLVAGTLVRLEERNDVVMFELLCLL